MLLLLLLLLLLLQYLIKDSKVMMGDQVQYNSAGKGHNDGDDNYDDDDKVDDVLTRICSRDDSSKLETVIIRPVWPGNSEKAIHDETETIRCHKKSVKKEELITCKNWTSDEWTNYQIILEHNYCNEIDTK